MGNGEWAMGKAEKARRLGVGVFGNRKDDNGELTIVSGRRME